MSNISNKDDCRHTAEQVVFYLYLLLKMRTISSEKYKIVKFVNQGKFASEISRLLDKRIALNTSFVNIIS